MKRHLFFTFAFVSLVVSSVHATCTEKEAFNFATLNMAKMRDGLREDAILSDIHAAQEVRKSESEQGAYKYYFSYKKTESDAAVSRWQVPKETYELGEMTVYENSKSQSCTANINRIPLSF